jgi:hypothetical protein
MHNLDVQTLPKRPDLQCKRLPHATCRRRLMVPGVLSFDPAKPTPSPFRPSTSTSQATRGHLVPCPSSSPPTSSAINSTQICILRRHSHQPRPQNFVAIRSNVRDFSLLKGSLHQDRAHALSGPAAGSSMSCKAQQTSNLPCTGRPTHRLLLQAFLVCFQSRASVSDDAAGNRGH